MNRPIDLTGNRFGKWTVLEYVGKRHWKCLCDCGTIKDVNADSLRQGRSTSCGCNRHPDLTGKRFGSLTVKDIVLASGGNGSHFKYVCVCDCGNEKVVRSSALKEGRVTSCGCLNGFRKQRKIIYKEITGKEVPSNMSVIFLDNNPNNRDIDNLHLVTHEAYNKMLINGWLNLDKKSKLVALQICETNVLANKILNKCNEREVL